MGEKGIVLGHNVSKGSNKVDRAKLETIFQFLPLNIVKSIYSFLEHVGHLFSVFYLMLTSVANIFPRP